MNFDMVKYVLSITTEYTNKLDILNKEKNYYSGGTDKYEH